LRNRLGKTATEHRGRRDGNMCLVGQQDCFELDDVVRRTFARPGDGRQR
jgi:hypothetical protein